MKDLPAVHKLEETRGYRVPKPRQVNHWVILAVTTNSQTTISVVTMGISTLAPFIAAGLNLNKTQVGVISAAFNLGMFFTFFLSGRLVDLWGEKVVLVWGGILTGLAVGLGAFSQSFSVLYLFFLLTGVCASTSTPAGSRAIMSWFPYAKRGFAMGIRQTGVPLGGLLAALILPFVALHVSWRAALGVAAVIACLGGLVCLIAYKNPLAPGDVLDPKPSNKLPLKRILLDTRIWRASYMGITYLAAQTALLVYLISYFHEKLGLPLTKASLFLALAQLAGGTGRVLWGMMTDTIFHGRRKPALIAMGVIAMVLSSSMTVLTTHTPLWILGLIVWFFGFSAIGWIGVYVALVSEMVGKEHSGTALGMGMTIIQIGVLVFAPLFGYVIDVSNSYQPAWYGLSALVLSGLFMLGMVREREDHKV